MRRKITHTISCVLMVISFITLIGLAGSYDMNYLTMSEILPYVVSSAIVMIISSYLSCITTKKKVRN